MNAEAANATQGSGSRLLQMRAIHKRFPGMHVLKGIDFDLDQGEVHALVGENGAGKTTLMHILAGVHQPDSGTIDFDGRSGVAIDDEHTAQNLGIAIVFQERSLFSPLSVAENVFAGRQPVNRWGKIDRAALGRETRGLLKQVGLDLPADSILAELSPAEQQMVEIAKALSLQAKLIIFDEPTAALTETETKALFAVIHSLKARRVGIIYISHRLEEVFRIADKVSILKDGEGQGTFAVSGTTPEALVKRMVGRELGGYPKASGVSTGQNRVVLEVRNLRDSVKSGRGRTVLNGISFEARAGEVLVFAGLAGAGRTELALSIFGARAFGSGEILVEGEAVRLPSPEAAIRAGVGYLPEDRKEAGLFSEMNIAENVAAARLRQFGSWWFNFRLQDSLAHRYRRTLRIASRNVRQAVQSLSGGNQQKVVLAKWLLVDPKVLIVDEPTRGIDVGAKTEVHALLRELARKGTAVIVISSELPEVLAVADRVLVLREGRIAGELSRAEATEEQIMRYASMRAADENMRSSLEEPDETQP